MSATSRHRIMGAVSSSLDPKKHERFYFSDGSLYLLVEDTLYRIHRYLFELHATNFPGIGNNYQSSNDNTRLLSDVNCVDFDRLLMCLYPRDLTVEEPQSLDEWTSILKLSSKWGFKSLQARAVSKVESLAPPIDMLVLGRQLKIPELILPAYVALCQTATPLSLEEGLQLGMEDVIGIYRIRMESLTNDRDPLPFSTDIVRNKVQRYLSLNNLAHVLHSMFPSESPTVSSPRQESDSWFGAASPTVEEKISGWRPRRGIPEYMISPSISDEWGPPTAFDSPRETPEPHEPTNLEDVLGETRTTSASKFAVYIAIPEVNA
ncbi:hypothetical protein AX17_007116 [Amanita inopinata Kibby_2008]|nr:hypothetical protein AX17_007116 [Amanita inopinata Kibby_2008]